jgi:hypothetical protein
MSAGGVPLLTSPSRWTALFPTSFNPLMSAAAKSFRRGSPTTGANKCSKGERPGGALDKIVLQAHRLAFVVDEKTVEIQKQYTDARSRLTSESPALFLNTSGERLSTQGIANIIAQFRKDAGIERHITPHMLRHTVATLLLRNGVDIRIVQEFLGHASIATTQRYTHITKDHLIRVLRERHPSLAIRMAS